MLVEVTKDDIRRGVAGDGEKCALALALHRATGRAWSVATDVIYPAALTGQSRSPIQEVELPEEAADFVDDFDGECATPGTFEIPVDAFCVKTRR